MVECENGNKSHFEKIIHCPYIEYSDSSNFPKLILEKNRQYLISRVGNEFYNKMILRDYYIIDFNNYEEIKKTKPWIGKELCNKNIKYALGYYFKIQDSLNYYITISYDKKGKMLSKHQLPNQKTNPNFYQIINLCDAKEIAEKDTVFSGKIINASLEFSKTKNSFIWRIEKPSEWQAKGIIIHKYLVINANNGNLIQREKEISRSVHYDVDF